MSQKIARRDFLKKSAKFGLAATALSLVNSRLFGAISDAILDKSIPLKTLNDGNKMPMLGFGTNTLTGELGQRCVAEAISVGYRLIDTAQIYGNEQAVGKGIKDSGIQRDKLFITSKLWVDNYGYEKAKAGVESSLKNLQTDYLNLYLLHRPRGDVKGAWQALEELHAAGKIKSIGVSNFSKADLAQLMTYAKVKPVINQIESNVYFQQEGARSELAEFGAQMEAWSPFMAGKHDIFNHETLASIGRQYNKSVAQVCLRWHHQRGLVTIPRTSQKAHMEENLNIFDFELSDADFKAIAALDKNTTQFPEWE